MIASGASATSASVSSRSRCSSRLRCGLLPQRKEKKPRPAGVSSAAASAVSALAGRSFAQQVDAGCGFVLVVRPQTVEPADPRRQSQNARLRGAGRRGSGDGQLPGPVACMVHVSLHESARAMSTSWAW